MSESSQRMRRELQYHPPLWGSYRCISNDLILVRASLRAPRAGDELRGRVLTRFGCKTRRALTPPADMVLGPPGATTRLIARYSPRKKPAQSTTIVAGIYPSCDPYLKTCSDSTFSSLFLMSRGEAERRIMPVRSSNEQDCGMPCSRADGRNSRLPDSTCFTLVFGIPCRIIAGLKHA